MRKTVAVARAVREGETWRLRLACGHDADAPAVRKKWADEKASDDASFESPPSRRSCPACEAVEKGSPTLF